MIPKTFTTADDLPIVAHFPEGELSAEKMSLFPGAYEDLETFGKYCRAAVEAKFEMAGETLFPLLKDIPFRAIGIYLSLGYKGDGAYYLCENSEPAKGEYYFVVQGECISCFLREFWEENYQLPQDVKYAPHHELIHLLDHAQLDRNQLSSKSRHLGSMLAMFFENFRKEGLAGLFGFLKIESERLEMGVAREAFLKELYPLTVLDLGDIKTYGEHLDIFQPLSVYELGPWMVLHALYVEGDAGQKETIATLINEYREGKEIPTDQILKIVGMGLQLPLGQFVAALGQPAWTGEPWLQLIFFKPLFYQLERLQVKRGINAFANPFLEEVFSNVFIKDSFSFKHK